jgi:uncharacterized OsmC-like protein
MMAEETLSVLYSREGTDSHLLVLGSPALQDLRIDYAGLPEEARGGTATRLLCAAALYCFASTLGSALTARGARVRSLTGRVTAVKGRDDYYRTRIKRLRIEVDVDLHPEDLPLLAKCEEIAERGCLMTYSLSEGIAVEHIVRHAGRAESGG